MPTTKSAKKRLRQSQEKRIKNRAAKHELKTRVKSVRESTKTGKSDAAKTAMVTLTQRLDRAAAKGVIHKNKASRIKSRLSKAMKKAAGK